MSSTAPVSTTTGRRTAKTTAAKTVNDELFPADLAGHGWTLKEHVDGGGKFQCVNTSLDIVTNAFVAPQDAIAAARRVQAKRDERQAGESVTAGPLAVSRRFTQPLKVKLSDAERLTKLDEYTEKEVKLAELKLEQKQVTDGYKGQITVLEKETGDILKVLTSKEEERDVECEERMDFQSKRVLTVRLDTEEEMSARAMTAQETQQRLPIV